MRASLLCCAVIGLLAIGCAGPERKLGRGIVNVTEFSRMGEIRRSMEQSAVFQNPDVAYTGGFIHGMNRSLARTFVGVYEILTFPIPDNGRNDYSAVYHPEHSVYPLNYQPRPLADSIFQPDAALGFGAGDVAPMIPGSRFRIFDH